VDEAFVQRAGINGEDLDMLCSPRTGRIAATLASAMLGTLATGASASPGAGITPERFVTADLLEDVHYNHDRIKFQTKDPTKVRVERLTFAPGAFTGWHHHPGTVIVSVASGFLTHVEAADCSATVYGPGSPNGSVFTEGSEESHQAFSPGGAVVYVTYVAPGSTFRVEEPVAPCGQ
jgi:hypothetical protein